MSSGHCMMRISTIAFAAAWALTWYFPISTIRYLFSRFCLCVWVSVDIGSVYYIDCLPYLYLDSCSSHLSSGVSRSKHGLLSARERKFLWCSEFIHTVASQCSPVVVGRSKYWVGSNYSEMMSFWTRTTISVISAISAIFFFAICKLFIQRLVIMHACLIHYSTLLYWNASQCC